jgi:hypothetical protein
MKHKYVVGDRVRNTNKEHKQYGQCGIIDAILPYTFLYPAYYVKYDNVDRTVAMSEVSLERIEVKDGE